MTTESTLLSEIKEDIVDRLQDRIGQEFELSELGFELTMDENKTGSWYCSTWKAEKALKSNYDEVANFMQYYQDNYGEKPEKDAFLDPEEFHLIFMIFCYESVFNQAVPSLDYEKVEITEDFIKNVKHYLTEVKSIF